MMTSGRIEALELLGKSFLDPEDVVVVGAPSYLCATMGFQSFGAVVVEVPLEEHGVRTDALEEAFAARSCPKLFYTIPDFQNPAGLTLSGPRRQEVVALARRYGVAVVEDVTYRDLSFTDERSPSLWFLQPGGVIQIGTFSKTIFPGVRLGWAAGPTDVIVQMILAKQNTDQCAGVLGQYLLEECEWSGELDRQIECARTIYRHRQDVMLDALQRHMPEGVTWTRPEGGFVTWLTLPEGIDANQLAEEARSQAIAFVPGSVFFPHPTEGRNHLRLSRAAWSRTVRWRKVFAGLECC